MSEKDLIDIVLLQNNLVTTILAFTALILAGLTLDVLIHLYKKYIKKKEKKEKERGNL